MALGAVDTALYAVGGKSHRPLDMVKVGQVLSLILPFTSRLHPPAAEALLAQPRELTQLDCSFLPRVGPSGSVSALCVSLLLVWTLPSPCS